MLSTLFCRVTRRWRHVSSKYEHSCKTDVHKSTRELGTCVPGPARDSQGREMAVLCMDLDDARAIFERWGHAGTGRRHGRRVPRGMDQWRIWNHATLAHTVYGPQRRDNASVIQ